MRGPVRESLRRAVRLARPRRWDGRGRVVVVTGGAGGIGAALAGDLAARGATLVLVDRDAARAERVAAGLPTAPGHPHRGLGADLTDEAEVRRVLADVAATEGRVDVLVNNTGMTSAERFGERTVASMAEELHLNTLSPLAVTRHALDLLRRSDDARVVTTVSLAGIFPQAETPVYCASKFGLRGAMLSVALDLAAEGITVSSVLPSATDTPMLRQEAVDGGNALQFQHPPQPPEVVAAAIVSLLDRPRLEAYPRPAEARLVRLVMAVPNLVPVLMPFFEGKGEDGMRRYVEELRRRGDVVDVDGRLEVVR